MKNSWIALFRRLYKTVPFIVFLMFQIIPPESRICKEYNIRDNLRLEKCVTQFVSPRGGMFELNMMGQAAIMSLCDFRERATNNAINYIDCTEAEKSFWNSLKIRGNVHVPIYAIDNERNIYPFSWPHFNLNKLNQVSFFYYWFFTMNYQSDNTHLFLSYNNIFLNLLFIPIDSLYSTLNAKMLKC